MCSVDAMDVSNFFVASRTPFTATPPWGWVLGWISKKIVCHVLWSRLRNVPHLYWNSASPVLFWSKSHAVHQGSITGAYSALTENVTPSFILLAIQDNKLVCYVYELNKGEVEVSKTEFTKKVSETNSPTLLQSLLS